MKHLLVYLSIYLSLFSCAALHAQVYNSTFDHNGDGCVGSADLIDFLGYYGGCLPWQCGDSLSYWDYAYGTVEMGDQCWFTDNLRTAVYGNGDTIPSLLTNTSWFQTLEGATAVYGDGSFINTACGYYNTASSWVCDETQSLPVFGRLYNWYAVDDTRGLCPTGWHVPTDEEWTNLRSYVIQQGFILTEGLALKTTNGWDEDGNGTDDFGFSGQPSGRRGSGGGFTAAERFGYWWSSTQTGDQAWFQTLSYNSSAFVRSYEYPRHGLSVRCIQD